MNALPSPKAVALVLPRVAAGLEKYSWLQSHLADSNVSRDQEYQRRFAGFYRLRRGAEWRDVFFGMLERYKHVGLSFGDALRKLHAATGAVEASFASKLVATIDPNQPVIDSVVLGHVGLRLPPPSARGRLGRTVALHESLCGWYEDQLNSLQGLRVVAQFRRAYRDAVVTDTKALDLVLWQWRGPRGSAPRE